MCDHEEIDAHESSYIDENDKVDGSVSDNGSEHTVSTSDHAPSIQISITWRKAKYDLEYAQNSTIEALFNDIEETFNIPKQNQKLLVAKGPMLKYPPRDPELPLRTLVDRQITLMGSPVTELGALAKMSEKIAARNAMHRAQKAHAKQAKRYPARSAEDSKYTFMQVKPLDWLPRPERSQTLLMRLKADPGIKHVMKKHKFTVALLTEMEPLQHTQSSHEGVSRTLGLNRNKGEVIELRLRTDAHDGYRDYKTIRKTLCHELTHNVHSDHDRKFWDLCGQIEKEVAQADWKSGGHTLEESSRYAIAGMDLDEDDGQSHADEGGWSGGEFILGASASSDKKTDRRGWSRREILANAALERQRKDDEAERKAEKGWRPCQRSQGGDKSD